jgi:hypothetical protein
MEWFERTPPLAKLAMTVGGAIVATLVRELPPGFQVFALCAGVALCAYGIGAAVLTFRESTNPEWSERQRRKDFERGRSRLLNTFKNGPARAVPEEVSAGRPEPGGEWHDREVGRMLNETISSEVSCQAPLSSRPLL